jgi:hypothetical protein
MLMLMYKLQLHKCLAVFVNMLYTKIELMLMVATVLIVDGCFRGVFY